MIKFKNININKLAEQFNTGYYTFDILRQSTIKKLVAFANNRNLTADETKDIILSNIKFLLDLMIV